MSTKRCACCHKRPRELQKNWWPRAYCKECRREKNNEWKKQHPERVREWARRYKEKNRGILILRNRLKRIIPCVDCGVPIEMGQVKLCRGCAKTRKRDHNRKLKVPVKAFEDASKIFHTDIAGAFAFDGVLLDNELEKRGIVCSVP